MFFYETELAAAMHEKILPYLAEMRVEKTVQSYDKMPLYTAFYHAPHSRGTVLMLHGFSETAEKYREMIYYFLKDGLSVLIFDQRGHGRSYRVAGADVTHIDRFESYIWDAEHVLAAYQTELTSPFYLFAHSMGGAVGILFMEKHPTLFEKAVLSSPMIALKQRGIVYVLSRLVCRFYMCMGYGQKRIFLSKATEEKDTFAHSSALSRTRFDLYHALRKGDSLLDGGAPTYAWSYEALGVKRQILKKGLPERIQTPILVFGAECEHLVQNEAQRIFADRLIRGKWELIPNSKHEFFSATDDIFHPYMQKVLDFFTT